MVDELYKTDGTQRLYDMEFKDDLRHGDTLASITNVDVSPPGATIDSEVVDGTRAQFKVSGGTKSVRYLFTVLVKTAAGDDIEGYGYLTII
ncbi:MAG: hypothetical protein KUG67_00505 [Proteobacteria bacterium]|nr:hypothetical protein [Pseudomonadota bacterium]